jgi:histidinol dehydrogenase
MQKVSINPVENHREREKGVIVYPVYSRRSGGLSVGINLFPDKKCCPFDCPYCEVFPFTTNTVFSLPQMEKELCNVISAAHEQNIIIRDICFSGNGEPSLSPALGKALKTAANIRNKIAPEAQLVLITNGAGLSHLLNVIPYVAGLDIWLKLDAGTPEWYQKINRCIIPFEEHIAKIKAFAAQTSFTIQTMLCAVDGSPPPSEEVAAWEALALELALTGNIRKVQLYGKARPAPEDPKALSLPPEYLENRASALRQLFTQKDVLIPVEVFY